MERRTPNELNGAHQAYKNDDLRRVAFHPRYKRDIYARVTPAKQLLPTIIGTHEYSCAPDTHPQRKSPKRQHFAALSLSSGCRDVSRFSPGRSSIGVGFKRRSHAKPDFAISRQGVADAMD